MTTRKSMERRTKAAWLLSYGQRIACHSQQSDHIKLAQAFSFPQPTSRTNPLESIMPTSPKGPTKKPTLRRKHHQLPSTCHLKFSKRSFLIYPQNIFGTCFDIITHSLSTLQLRDNMGGNAPHTSHRACSFQISNFTYKWGTKITQYAANRPEK